MELEEDPREVQLSDIMYCIGMESREAHFHMEMLCKELKIPFPPKRIETPLEKINAKAEYLEER